MRAAEDDCVYFLVEKSVISPSFHCLLLLVGCSGENLGYVYIFVFGVLIPCLIIYHFVSNNGLRF